MAEKKVHTINFRDFAYCYSGMIPWLLVAVSLSERKLVLFEILSERITTFPSSGEINYMLDEPDKAISSIVEKYKPES